MPSLTPHPSNIGQICHICPERALSWLGGAAQRPFPGACGRPGGGSPGYSLAPRASAPSLRVAHSAAPAAAAVYSSGGCVPRVEPGHHSGYKCLSLEMALSGQTGGRRFQAPRNGRAGSLGSSVLCLPQSSPPLCAPDQVRWGGGAGTLGCGRRRGVRLSVVQSRLRKGHCREGVGRQAGRARGRRSDPAHSHSEFRGSWRRSLLN